MAAKPTRCGSALTYLAGCLTLILVSGCAETQKPGRLQIQTGTLKFSKTVKTWKDLRQRNVTMQNRDYSCGAASLATLLNYYFDDPVTEADIMKDMFNTLSESKQAERTKTGFSLLDLRNFAQRRGYAAVGARIKIADLLSLRGPVLVYLETPNFRHFAVLRGIREDRIFLADPSRGNLRLSVDQFIREWPGIILALGKKGFGTPQDHALAVSQDSLFRNELTAVRLGLYR